MDIQEYIQSGIIENYVLGLATAEEITEVEDASSKYSEVKKAIREFEALLESHSVRNAVTSPPHIKSNLEEILKSEFLAGKESTEKNFDSNIITPVRRMYFWRYMAAASIILLAISTGLNFYFYSGFKESSNKYQALLSERSTLQANNASYQNKLNNMQQSLQLMEDPHMVSIKMKGVQGKDQNLATVYWDTRTKEVYLYPNEMDKIPPGKQYQLWAIVDGKPVDAGMVGDCEGLCKMKVINRAEAFAITLEKEGGSSAPTLTAMYVMGKV
jgi:anti-sigma-K factor RskA